MHPYLLSFSILIIAVAIYVIAIKPRFSVWASTGFLVIATLGLYIMTDGMGLAKPIRAELFRAEKQEIIAHYGTPGQSLYLWVQSEDGPIAYRLDWDPKKAKKLEEHRREGKRSYLSYGDDGENDIEEIPQPPMPLKQE